MIYSKIHLIRLLLIGLLVVSVYFFRVVCVVPLSFLPPLTRIMTNSFAEDEMGSYVEIYELLKYYSVPSNKPTGVKHAIDTDNLLYY